MAHNLKIPWTMICSWKKYLGRSGKSTIDGVVCGNFKDSNLHVPFLQGTAMSFALTYPHCEFKKNNNFCMLHDVVWFEDGPFQRWRAWSACYSKWIPFFTSMYCPSLLMAQSPHTSWLWCSWLARDGCERVRPGTVPDCNQLNIPKLRRIDHPWWFLWGIPDLARAEADSMIKPPYATTKNPHVHLWYCCFVVTILESC